MRAPLLVLVNHIILTLESLALFSITLPHLAAIVFVVSERAFRFIARRSSDGRIGAGSYARTRRLYRVIKALSKRNEKSAFAAANMGGCRYRKARRSVVASQPRNGVFIELGLTLVLVVGASASSRADAPGRIIAFSPISRYIFTATLQ